MCHFASIEITRFISSIDLSYLNEKREKTYFGDKVSLFRFFFSPEFFSPSSPVSSRPLSSQTRRISTTTLLHEGWHYSFYCTEDVCKLLGLEKEWWKKVGEVCINNNTKLAPVSGCQEMGCESRKRSTFSWCSNVPHTTMKLFGTSSAAEVSLVGTINET